MVRQSAFGGCLLSCYVSSREPVSKEEDSNRQDARNLHVHAVGAVVQNVCISF